MYLLSHDDVKLATFVTPPNRGTASIEKLVPVNHCVSKTSDV